jgi:hypothetical protein
MSLHEQKIRDGVAPFLEDGERVLAAMIAGVKRLALGYTITLTVRGIAITLEANAASRARGFADPFERVTARRS